MLRWIARRGGEPYAPSVRVGVLTGGGDCPGLNAVIRAIVRQAERVHGDEVVGFLDAWDGVIGRKTMPLTIETMRGTLPRGGTVLGTKRGSPFDTESGVDDVAATISDLGLDAIIVIGGNGTLTVACQLHHERGMPIVGVPKTIDNDIVGTDVTFGFHTAVQIATDAIDRLHTTAESHDRVMVVEVMGRHAGWIATYAGIAGGAATTRGASPPSSWSPRGPSPAPAPWSPSRARSTSSVTSVSGASPTTWPSRSRSAPTSRPA